MDTQSETPTKTASTIEQVSARLESFDPNPKPFLQSKTIWGGLLLLGLAVAQLCGFDLEAESAKATELLELVGSALVVIGLRQADRPLSFDFRKLLRSGSARTFTLLGPVMVVGGALALAGLPACSHIPEGSSVRFHSGTLGAGVECDDEGCRVDVAPAVDSQ